MKYRRLGHSDLNVSAICLGSMTWGSQNSESEAHDQLDYATDHGVNFIDTAELYPVTPPSRETQGRTEEIIGTWLQGRKRRETTILASKVAGPAFDPKRPVRGGNNRLDRRNIEQAINDSLRRLRTDYLDLYQIHWPDRTVAMFGDRARNSLDDHPDTVPIEETLSVLADLVTAGKVRHVGVSNETSWGAAEYLRLARDGRLPRIASIQNAYNLLNRLYEGGLAEFSLREGVGLLAYSPLAAGHLTGKYLGGVTPPGSRLAVTWNFARYDRPTQPIATAQYVAIAHAHGLDAATMALAFVNQQPFVTANIIGATTPQQLAVAIASIDVTLDEAVVAAIEAVHAQLPDPCP
ncbi:aldo/keto reductase [Sphingomonas sp. ID0503]|uniref:aldo/keto reductase n=1 Tax=Sphingomonas sp. ID0503 TaxID=3399691 RepID=UPI003AFAC064